MDTTTLYERCNKMIWDIANTLKGVVYAKNMTFSVVRLLFLKYVTDNCLKADNSDKMMNYVRVQRMFAARDNEGGQAAVYPVLQMLDETYGLDNVLTSALNEYAKDLFGTDVSWGRKNSTMTHHKAVMGAVAELNLEEEPESNILGKTMVECLSSTLDVMARDVIAAGEAVTPATLAALAAKLVRVEDGETYADFVSGAGLSTLRVVGETKANIINSEINSECAAVAAMLYIMAGYENIKITVENSLAKYEDEHAVADKMFIDAPLNVRKIIEDKNLSSSYLAVEKAVNMLKENGTAVVVVPGSTLFGMNKPQVEQRKNILNNKWLKAVIALPPCFYGAGVGVNLLVISKTENENVLFVNAVTNNIFTFSVKEKRTNTLTEEGIAKIAEIIENGEVINGISRFCSIEEIANMNYDLTPARYVNEIIVDEAEEAITLKDIDAELAELYKKLGL